MDVGENLYFAFTKVFLQQKKQARFVYSSTHLLSIKGNYEEKTSGNQLF